jgi:hypothetical protein
MPPGDPAIIDCTCEFPRLKGFSGGLPYMCVPTWDTRSPQPGDIEHAVKWACRKRDLNRPIFVHCAYGNYHSSLHFHFASISTVVLCFFIH